MTKIIIKNIPETEPYLFATIAGLHFRGGLLRIPRIQSVKFVLTNKNLYLKVHGYLIDTTGPVKISLDSITKLIIEQPAIKTFKTKYLTFVNTDDNRTKFTITQEECSKIKEIFNDIAPTIEIEENIL